MQPMDKLINLAALQNYPLRRGNPGCDEVNANPHFLNGVESVIEFAENLPTIDPVQHGWWASHGKGLQNTYCSICSNRRMLGTPAKFCSNCGAKMGAKEE